MEDAEYDRGRDFAKACYKACGCEGFARVDVFYTKDKEFFINEINTFPGFTPSSFFGRMAESLYQISFSELLDKLIEDGFRRGL